MQKALEQQPYAARFKAYLITQLAIPAERCRTRD
jgi:hemoglobin